VSKLSKSNIKRAAHLVLFQGMKSKLHPPPLSAQKQNPAPSSVLAPPSQSSRELLWRMLKFLKPVWKTATIAGLIILARAFSEVSMVYFLSPAVTTVATGLAGSAHELNFFDWLTGAGSSAVQLRSVLLWMGLMQVVLGCMIYLRSVWDTKLSMGAVYHIRAGVYDRLQRADLAFHDRMSSGQLINRAMNDLQAVRHFVNLSVLSSLDIVASLTLYLGLLYFRSPMLMFAALFALPPLYLAIDKFSRRAQPLCYLQQQASDALMNTLSENLSGVQVIRAFATEDQERGKYAVQNQTLLKHLLKSVHLQAALTPSLKLIATTAHIGLFAFAALLLRQGVLQIGDVLLLGATMAAVLGKLQQINAIVEAYQRAIVSSRRLFEILDLPNAVSILRPKERGLLRITQGEIEFRDLCFNHRGRRTLSEVSAKIPGGKITALVGPTGSGKTTLASLGFMTPTPAW
jgi:ATP-binding cassette subfamily B protein